jgi:hypothetical protein
MIARSHTFSALALLSTLSTSFVSAATATEAPLAAHNPKPPYTQTRDTGTPAPTKVTTLPKNGISDAQARAIVADKYPTRTIELLKLLTKKNGAVAYGVRFIDKSVLFVDALSGKITLSTQTKQRISLQPSKKLQPVNITP